MTRSVYTTLTPLPPGIPRYIVRETLHDHFLMIDLNPLVIRREKMAKPIGKATAEEYHSTWYEITDRISYFPGVKGQVTYHGCFHNLDNGLQTHIYAPMGLDIKEKWTIGGNEPGEPRETPELGIQAPKEGLYLREDTDVSVNFTMMSFVKKNLVQAHKVLVDRMVEKAKIVETKTYNDRLRASPTSSYSMHSSPHPQSPGLVPPHPQTYVGYGQGFTSPTQVYDDRYGPHGQGWMYDPNAGPYPRPLNLRGPAPPYEYYGGHPSDQKFYDPDTAFGRPPPASIPHPHDPSGKYRMSMNEPAIGQPQELPAAVQQEPAELQ